MTAMDVLGSTFFWFAWISGVCTGLLFAVIGYIPYRNRRLQRLVDEAELDTRRILGGLRSVPERQNINDAVGAFREASTAERALIIYPGPDKLPEPAWVSWVERHGQYRPYQETGAHGPRRTFVFVFVAVALMWTIGDALFRLAQMIGSALGLMWAVGMSYWDRREPRWEVLPDLVHR